MKYIVYIEIIKDAGGLERWYYGTYSSEHQANEIALELGQYSVYGVNDTERVYHCVCKADEAESLEIMNMPNEKEE